MKEIQRLLEIMESLRDPEKGCPWDREQTLESIVPYTMEETYELADAIKRKDMDGLCGELGDLLFHIVFYAQMASETGHFDFHDVTKSVNEKLQRRHPHVFGDSSINSVEEQSASWEKIKQEERRGKASKNSSPGSILDGLHHTLPAVMHAQKLQKRASTVGFDWDDVRPVLEKIEEEISELKQAVDTDMGKEKLLEELGDVMFACVNFARLGKFDAEIALINSNRKFERRFRYIEQQLALQEKTLQEASLDEMESLWHEAKGLE